MIKHITMFKCLGAELLLHIFQGSSGDIFDFINTKLGGKRGEI